MNEASLSESGDGRWILAGNLDFATVPQVWPALERVLGLGQPVKLSLGQVDHANSAGLVLLIEALDVARRAPSGARILVMLPDIGERYLSTPLFEGIEEEMDDEEMALMRSTPGYQMP